MESSVYAEFKGKVKKLDYSLGVTVNRSSYSQRGEDADYERYTVSPRLTLFYALPGESSIRLKSTMGNVTPSLGELSAIDQVIDYIKKKGKTRSLAVPLTICYMVWGYDGWAYYLPY